jgi:WD repeat-containing protein 61
MAMLYSEKQIDEAHEVGIWSCQWTARDEIVTASNDQTCAIWDASTGALKHTLKDCGQGAVSIVSDRTGDILASSQIDCHIKVWDAASGTCRGTIDTGTIDGVVDAWTLCSDGGSEVVSGTNHGSINCWDLTTLKKTATHKVSEDPKAFVLSVGRHEDIVATANYDGQLRTVDVRSGACTTFSSKDREDPVRSLCFVRGGSGLLFASDDGSVRYFDRRKPDQAAYTMYCAQSWCMSVRASPDGKHFCTAGADRLVKFWDLDEKREVARVDGHTDQVWDVAYSPDGSRLVSVADDGRVRFHDKERADVALWAHDEEVAAEKRTRAEDAAAMDVETTGVDGVDVSSLPLAPPASFLREAAKWATI